MNNFLQREIVLENDIARLEPLNENHFEPLWEQAKHEELWTLSTFSVKQKDDFRKYFDIALTDKLHKRSCPYAIFDKRVSKYAGSTRLGNIVPEHKRLEIGWTWYGPSFQRTGLNRNCKFLLLRWGFETLELNRIELKTSLLNMRSQKAMEQIGAVKEGIFRNHMINPDGSLRDSIYYSFIIQDWPAIKDSIFKNYF
ncbi:MAG: GNAT family N-acetyltransferase [Bacteroidetes bacterium]|nr:GNAT family N-acetyltransferase [Bacteroidota bacterium]MBS1757989.1 GNAT family N-acetyltransferase [Bacteroidota bacterium]